MALRLSEGLGSARQQRGWCHAKSERCGPRQVRHAFLPQNRAEATGSRSPGLLLHFDVAHVGPLAERLVHSLLISIAPACANSSERLSFRLPWLDPRYAFPFL